MKDFKIIYINNIFYFTDGIAYYAVSDETKRLIKISKSNIIIDRPDDETPTCSLWRNNDTIMSSVADGTNVGNLKDLVSYVRKRPGVLFIGTGRESVRKYLDDNYCSLISTYLAREVNIKIILVPQTKDYYLLQDDKYVMRVSKGDESLSGNEILSIYNNYKMKGRGLSVELNKLRDLQNLPSMLLISPAINITHYLFDHSKIKEYINMIIRGIKDYQDK